LRKSSETLAAFRDRLAVARAKLLKHEPFLGFLALELPTHIIVSADHEVETAATDGKSYWYNYNWCSQLTDSELVFVVAHEIAHVLFLHALRREKRDMHLWNAACDYAVNGILVASTRDGGNLAGIATIPVEVNSASGRYEKIGLWDERFAELPAEVIYDQLVKEGGDVGANWDQLLEATTDEDQKCSVRRARAATAKALVRAKDYRDRRGHGHEPGLWERWAAQELRGTVRWQDRFRTQVLGWGNDVLSWSRPNRKYASHGLYLPRYRGYQLPNILFAFDTSGSISDEFLGLMVGELNALLLCARNSVVRVICCDAGVHVLGDFSASYRLDPRFHSLRGGGGTDFRPVFDYAREHNSFRHLVFLTDTLGTLPDEPPPGLFTLWLVPDSQFVSLPFGKVIGLPITT
jgi:predicted metal-dependent peptidase